MQESKQKSLEKSTDFSINERVRVFCKMMNLIPADIERLGINKSTVSKVFANEQGVTLNFVHKLKLKFSNLNFEWLIFGEGNMFLNAGPKFYPDNEKLNITEDGCGMCRIKDAEISKLKSDLMAIKDKYIALLEQGEAKKENASQNRAQAG